MSVCLLRRRYNSHPAAIARQAPTTTPTIIPAIVEGGNVVEGGEWPVLEGADVFDVTAATVSEVTDLVADDCNTSEEVNAVVVWSDGEVVGDGDSGSVDERNDVGVDKVVDDVVVDDAAASTRSPKKTLHRTRSFTTWLGGHLVPAGQHA